MHFLHALGINQYAIVQFFVFVLMFTFLTIFVFGPYFRAASAREKRTASVDTVASDVHHRTQDLQAEYQNKARSLRDEVQAIFQKNRGEATTEYDRIVNQARQEAGTLIERNRKEVTQAIESAGKDLNAQTSTMAMAITNKLLGK